MVATSTLAYTKESTSEKKAILPPLESGDRLTRAEFHRRYKAMPEVKKAELIEGIVLMSSPARRIHGKQHAAVITALGLYQAATPGTELLDNVTVFLDADNEVQPDILLRLERAGTSSVTEEDYIDGPPELVFEIANTSATYDLHDKLNVYRRTGVKEYIVWTIQDSTIYWYRLDEGQYILAQVDSEGIVHSTVFPGLDLHAKALLQGEMSQVLATMQAGINSTAHAEFVKTLGG
ncbi:Uma2 family endonuclease [bacterium]|nr:Uma2 family endonuclease [bacterium]